MVMMMCCRKSIRYTSCVWAAVGSTILASTKPLLHRGASHGYTLWTCSSNAGLAILRGINRSYPLYLCLVMLHREIQSESALFILAPRKVNRIFLQKDSHRNFETSEPFVSFDCIPVFVRQHSDVHQESSLSGHAWYATCRFLPLHRCYRGPTCFHNPCCDVYL